MRDALALHALPEADTNTATAALQLPHQPGCQTSPSHQRCRDIGHCQPILVAMPTLHHHRAACLKQFAADVQTVMLQRKRKTGLLAQAGPQPATVLLSTGQAARQPGRQGVEDAAAVADAGRLHQRLERFAAATCNAELNAARRQPHGGGWFAQRRVSHCASTSRWAKETPA